MPIAQETVEQTTAPAPEQTEEEQYHADIARLEAAVQAAEDLCDQAEQAVWAQAQRCAFCTAIANAGGFRGRSSTPPSETREIRWRAIPQTEEKALKQLLDTRVQQIETLERARVAVTHRHARWHEVCVQAAFLKTPEGQFLARELEETRAALEVAKASNQGDMLGVLTRKLASVEKEIVSARGAWRQRR